MTDADAAVLLKEKMAVEKEAGALKQKYTAKMAKALPPGGLRYAQFESRIQNMNAYAQRVSPHPAGALSAARSPQKPP